MIETIYARPHGEMWVAYVNPDFSYPYSTAGDRLEAVGRLADLIDMTPAINGELASEVEIVTCA